MIKTENKYLQGREAYIKLAYESYTGGYNYIKSNLVQHSRESDTHFGKRLNYAFYINLIGKIVDVLSGFVIRNITRDLGLGDNDLARAYLDEIDLFQPANDFIRDKIADYLLTGNAIALADSIPGTDGRAYLHDIDYRNLNDYTIQTGQITKVSIYYPGESEEDEFTVTYTNDNLVKSNGKISAVEDNKIKKIPFVAVSKNLRVKKAYFEDAVYTNRALFNLYNTINKELFDSGFLIMVISTFEDNVDPETLKFIKAMPGHSEDKPYFLEPPTGHLDFTIKYINDIIEKLLNTLNIYRSQESDASGLSKSFDYAMMAGLLTRVAGVFESFERRLWAALALYDPRIKVDKIKVEYNKEFDIRTLTEELDNAIKLMAIDVSDTFAKEIRKKIANKMIEDDATRQKIIDEIDSSSSSVFSTNKDGNNSDGGIA